MSTHVSSGREVASGTPDSPRSVEVAFRLHRAGGQMSGVSAMAEQGRNCTEVLDQLAAIRAAVNATAMMVLSDHVDSCVNDAIESGGSDAKVVELVSTVRHCVRTT